MKWLFLPVVLLCHVVIVHAQYLEPDFSIGHSTNICVNSPIFISNQSSSADRIYWDFCPETFSETPSITSTSKPGVFSGYGYKLVEDAGQWYGFLLNSNDNKLLRLDFGSNPTSQPIVTDLGNPGGLMSAPGGLDFYKEGNTWYAVAGKRGNATGQVVRFSFGSDLKNSPVATGLGDFGFATAIPEVKIVKQQNQVIMLLLVYGFHSLHRIDYGSSILNAPISQSTIAITGANLPVAFSIASYENPWRIHVINSSGANSVQQVSFGNDLMGTLSVEGTYSYASITQPLKIQSVTSAGKSYCVIANNSATKPTVVIDFDDLSLTVPPVEKTVAGAFLIGFDIAKYQGKLLLQGSYNDQFKIITYNNACPATSLYSTADIPDTFSYSQAGNYAVDLSIETGPIKKSHSLVVHVQNNQAPDVAIATQNICAQQGVNFSVQNTSGDLSTFEWNFGDNTTSSDPAPQHTYGASGTYAVATNVTSSAGCFASATRSLKVYAAPVSSFELPADQACTNNDIVFTNLINDVYDGNLAYQWFIDDQPVSADRDLSHTFITTGDHAIKLIASIAGCSSESIQILSNVGSGPAVDFASSGHCQNEPVIFETEIADPVTSFAWSVENNVIHNEHTTQHTFSGYGSYEVILSAVAPNGCNTTKRKNIIIYSEPSPNFDIDAPPHSCSGSGTQFYNLTGAPSDSEIIEYLWTFGDTNGSTAVVNEPVFVYESSGTYGVSLFVKTNQGCIKTLEKPITIAQSPLVQLTNSPTCVGVPSQFTASGSAIASYFWEIGTAYYTTANVTHNFSTPGTRSIFLEVTGTNNCKTNLTKTITVPARLTPDFSVTKNCKDVAAVFNDITTGVDPVASRLWDFNGAGVSTLANPEFTFNSTGSKSIKLDVTSAAGCQYSVTKNIGIVENPIAAFTPSYETAVPPIAIGFSNQSQFADSYSWSFETSAGSETSTQVSPVFEFTELGEHDVTLVAKNDEGCEDIASQTITLVAPLPDVDLELISTSQNSDGTWKVIVTIHNKGNTILRNLPVSIDISGQFKLTEHVAGPIDPNSQYNLVLSYGIQPSPSLDFICAETRLEGDLVPDDNRICTDFEDSITITPAYPNPTRNDLTIEWIAAGGEVVEVNLFDTFGKLIVTHSSSAVEGLNQLKWNVNSIQSGLYILTIRARSQSGSVAEKTQRIFISPQN